MKFLATISSSIFSVLFFLLSQTLITQMLIFFVTVHCPWSSVHYFVSLLSPCCSQWVISTDLSSSSLILSCAILNLLLWPSSELWKRKWQPKNSSVLAWRIPGTGEPGGLPTMGPHRVGHDWSDLAAAAAAVNYFIFQIRNICFGTFFLISVTLLRISIVDSLLSYFLLTPDHSLLQCFELNSCFL